MSPAERPISPHLQIYKPQLTTVLSILHRFTGVGLVAGAAVLVAWLIAAAHGAAAFDTAQGMAGAWYGRLLLFLWAFALFYHLCNGIRHLVWDTGHWLDLKGCYASGYGVLIVSTALTAIAWIAGFTSLGHS